MSDEIRVTWLGQNGFAIADKSGNLCLVDPYLSDSIKEDGGAAERQVPIVLNPLQTHAIAAISSHWHQDHLDPVTCKALHVANPRCIFAGPASNLDRLVNWWHIPSDRTALVSYGATVSVPPFTFRGCFARHEVAGWLTEDAISIVIEVAGRRIFHSGDTEYDPLIREAAAFGPIDLGLFAINGTGGNMNVYEAAMLAFQLEPRIAVPMHYGMWTPDKYGGPAGTDVHRPTLNPDDFVDLYRRLGGKEARVMRLGEALAI